MNQEARRQGVWESSTSSTPADDLGGMSSRVSVGTSGCCQSWVQETTWPHRSDELSSQTLVTLILKPSHKYIDLLEKNSNCVITLNDVLSLHFLKTIYMIHLLFSQEYPRIEDLYHIFLMTVSCEDGFLFLLFLFQGQITRVFFPRDSRQ